MVSRKKIVSLADAVARSERDVVDAAERWYSATPHSMAGGQALDLWMAVERLKLTRKGAPELDVWKLESDIAVAVSAERAACLQIVRGAVNKFAALAKLKAR